MHQPACLACKTYCEYCIQALREMWEEEWGDFEFAVGKFKTCDKSFLDTGQFQSENMHLIIDFLKKHNKKKKNYCILILLQKIGVCGISVY